MKTRQLARSALIGALYALLTLFATLPVYAGAQLRVSEALCILPAFCPEAVWGLFVGCIAANLLTGALWLDVIFGSLASLAAAQLVLMMKKRGASPWLLPLPSVIVNAVVVGILLKYAYGLGFSLPICMLSVAAGQAASCYGLGMPLYFALDRFGKKLFK